MPHPISLFTPWEGSRTLPAVESFRLRFSFLFVPSHCVFLAPTLRSLFPLFPRPFSPDHVFSSRLSVRPDLTASPWRLLVGLPAVLVAEAASFFSLRGFSSLAGEDLLPSAFLCLLFSGLPSFPLVGDLRRAVFGFVRDSRARVFSGTSFLRRWSLGALGCHFRK